MSRLFDLLERGGDVEIGILAMRPLEVLIDIIHGIFIRARVASRQYLRNYISFHTSTTTSIITIYNYC